MTSVIFTVLPDNAADRTDADHTGIHIEQACSRGNLERLRLTDKRIRHRYAAHAPCAGSIPRKGMSLRQFKAERIAAGQHTVKPVCAGLIRIRSEA